MQMVPRVLQAAHYLRRNHIAGHTHDEQLAEVRVEISSGGTRESLHPRIVA